MLPITRANLQNFCRVCLRDITELKEKDLSLNIENATNYKNNLPNKMCSNCFIKLNALRQFRCRAIIATGVLKAIFDEEKLKETSGAQANDALAKLQTICRICLKVRKVQHSTRENCNLAHDVFNCTGLNLGMHDKPDATRDVLSDNAGFPTKICDKCNTTLKSFKEFQMLSKQTIEYLKNIFEEMGHEVEAQKPTNNKAQLSGYATELIDHATNKMPVMTQTVGESNVDSEPVWLATGCKLESVGTMDTDCSSFKTDEEIESVFATNIESTTSELPQSNNLNESCSLKLKKQRASKTNQNTFKCMECNKKFYKEFMYDAHIKSVHDKVDKPFICPHCSKAFRLVQVLHRHISCCKENANIGVTANKGSRKINHLCLLCDKCFKRKEHLKEHTRAVHQKLKLFPCEICGKAFGTKNTQMRHQKNHSAQKPFSCEYCAKRYNLESELRVHIQRHTTNPALLCPICKRAKQTLEELEEHISMHKSSYQCTICGKIFKKMFHLREHESTVHLKLRSLKCSFCDETFLIRKTLKNHEKSHDAIGRPEKCVICKLNFKSKRALLLHTKKIHAKES